MNYRAALVWLSISSWLCSISSSSVAAADPKETLSAIIARKTSDNTDIWNETETETHYPPLPEETTTYSSSQWNNDTAEDVDNETWDEAPEDTTSYSSSSNSTYTDYAQDEETFDETTTNVEDLIYNETADDEEISAATTLSTENVDELIFNETAPEGTALPLSASSEELVDTVNVTANVEVNNTDYGSTEQAEPTEIVDAEEASNENATINEEATVDTTIAEEDVNVTDTYNSTETPPTTEEEPTDYNTSSAAEDSSSLPYYNDEDVPEPDHLPAITKFTAINNPKLLNVHIVPHTHDHVGWLKTVEQYYYGLNQTIQPASVKLILDSLVDALEEKPYRTFSYAEQKFFSQWWLDEDLPEGSQESVHKLIEEGQWHFVNGGWSVNDEACSHFMGMIDQMTLGHDFLRRELNYIPKIGWQLNPYGHSSTQASLMTSKLGFDAMYFGRMDYQDLGYRRATQEAEGLWQGSESMPDETTVFWGLTGSYNGGYSAPWGFNFNTGMDHAYSYDDPVLQNMTWSERFHRVSSVLLPQIAEQARATKGNHIMLTMGDDFEYQNAPVKFESLDRMIETSNYVALNNVTLMEELFGDMEYETIQFFYSSPEYYTTVKFEDWIHQDKYDYSIKTDDFFPYADCPNCYWTGYFVSRPGFKRMERVASSFLMAARQMEALPLLLNETEDDDDSCDCGTTTYSLEDALGVAQHHDAISGTSKQHVAFDYAKKIQDGLDTASDFVIQQLKGLLLQEEGALQNLQYCQLLNETSCEVTSQGSYNDLYIIVYNALAQERSSVIRLPMAAEGTYLVSRVGSDEEDDSRILQSVPVGETQFEEGAEHVLYFDTGTLPPVGASIYKITMANEDDDVSLAGVTLSDPTGGHVMASNGILDVQFDASTGELSRISKHGKEMKVEQTWGYYTSFQGNHEDRRSLEDWNYTTDQSSGAYIFRPAEPNQDIVPFAVTDNVKFVKAGDAIEAHISFEEDWIRQVTRLSAGQEYVEVEYTIGPIPIDDGVGKEIVTQYHSDIHNLNKCFTDANGREFQERVHNSRPTWDLEVNEPVAGNYYPVNTAMYIEDSHSALAVVTDRTQGGGCLATDGILELMVQRRTIRDDARGVYEAMNETVEGMTPYPPYGDATRQGTGVIIRGKHRILIGKGNRGAGLARSAMDGAFSEPLVFAGSVPAGQDVAFRVNEISAIQDALPENIMLVTFLRREKYSFLVRVAHQFAVNEHPVLSAPAELDLAILFKGYDISDVLELTLSANQAFEEWAHGRMDWTGYGLMEPAIQPESTVIHLNPMDIRTFIIDIVGSTGSTEENSMNSEDNATASSSESSTNSPSPTSVAPPPPTNPPHFGPPHHVPPPHVPPHNNGHPPGYPDHSLPPHGHLSHPPHPGHTPSLQPHHLPTYLQDHASEASRNENSLPLTPIVAVLAVVAVAAVVCIVIRRMKSRGFQRVVSYAEKSYDLELTQYPPGGYEPGLM